MQATWGNKLGGTPPAPWWGDAIKAARQSNPKGAADLVFLADTYWGREWELLECGFDFATDKAMYDRCEDRMGLPG